MRRTLIYLQAVLGHWGSLVTGGAFIGVIGVYQGTGHIVSPWVYWGIAAAASVVAFYLAWQDQFLRVREVEGKLKEAAERANSLAPAPHVDVHISRENLTPSDGPPKLGMRTVQPEEGLRRGGLDGSHLVVDFRIRHLSGRPATSVEIKPIHSQRGHYSIRLEGLSFLPSGGEETLKFEVWKLDQRPSRKAIALGGATQWLGEFVRDSHTSDHPSEHPFVVWFRDGDDSLRQRFRLLYDPRTDGLQIVDDYPPYPTFGAYATLAD